MQPYNFLKKSIKGIRNPELTLNYIRNRLQLLPNYLSDGSFSFKPRIIYIGVNSVCNAKCIMCDIGTKNRESTFYKNLIKEGDFSPELLIRLIDEVKIFRPQIHINTTEPLLYNDLINVAQYIIEAGLKLSITTNGFLLEKYAQDFVKIGIDNVHVSLDGVSETHNSIRGRDFFEKAIEGIVLLDEYKGKFNKNKPEIKVNYTISNLNYNNLVDFLKYMKDYKISSFTFSHLNYVTNEMARTHNEKFGFVGNATTSSLAVIDPSKIDIDYLFTQIQRIKKEFPKLPISFIPEIIEKSILREFYNNPKIIITKKRCVVPWTSASVQPNGDMVILARCFKSNVGNIKQHSFKQIWNGEVYRKFRRILKQERYFPACTRCCGML